MLPPPRKKLLRSRLKIAALEQSRKTCGDSRIRAVIEHWIEEQKIKLNLRDARLVDGV
jgi:hypothetical protein